MNAINETGDTALHKAAYTGREDLVVLLLANQADVFTINDEGNSAKLMAQNRSIAHLIAAAEDADMKKREDRFLSAARNGDTDCLHELLNDPFNPVDINCQDVSGNSALHCAAYRGQKEVAVFLLKHGVDVTLKNKRGQLAVNLAPSFQMKQLLQDVKPISVRSLPKTPVIRLEGPLLKKGRFLGWRGVWVVLERGVLSFFSNRADATTGTKRRGYKYLESALVEPSDKDPTVFTIYFSDKSRVVLAIAPSTVSAISQIDRQKWINASKEHIEYSTNFIRQGIGLDDDDEDDLRELMTVSSMQPMLQTAHAHYSVLEKHIKNLMQFVEEDLHSFEGSARRVSVDDHKHVGNSRFYGKADFEDFWSALKFHLNLILESSSNTSASLTQTMAVLSRQEQVSHKSHHKSCSTSYTFTFWHCLPLPLRPLKMIEPFFLFSIRDLVSVARFRRQTVGQLYRAVRFQLRELQMKQEKDRCRVLEEALRVLAQEHQGLEQSLVASNAVPCYSSPPRPQSGAGSDADTDMEEYHDAFDDESDEKEDDESKSTQTLTGGNATQASALGTTSVSRYNSAESSLTQTLTAYATPPGSLNDLCDNGHYLTSSAR